MNVFYNLADPHSRSAAFSPTTANGNDRNTITFSGGNTYTLPVTGNSLFFSSRLRYLMLHTSNAGYNAARSGFFALYNTDNKLMCTIGWHDTASLIAKMVIKAYNDAGAVTGTTLVPHPIPLNNENNLQWPLFTFFATFDPVTSKNRLTLHYYGTTFGEVYDTAVTSVSNVSLGKLTINPLSQGMYTYPTFSDIIITDTENYMLESVVFKPATLHASNQFTGTIGSLRTWSQDRVYISNSSEVNVTASFTISPPNSDIGYYTALPYSSIYKYNTLSDLLYDVVQYDQYFMGRYVQDGGVSVTFTGSVVDAGDSNLMESHTVVVPANQDDTRYYTRPVDRKATNLKLSAIKNATVKYVLTGV